MGFAPATEKKSRLKHHLALPFEEIGGFMSRLRALDGWAPQALEFTVLTVARTGEVLGARPGEFELEKALWTIPDRMPDQN